MPYNIAVDITKSDTVDIVGPKKLTDAVWVGSTGTIVAVFENGDAVTFTLTEPALLPIAIKRIKAASTATTFQALYDI